MKHMVLIDGNAILYRAYHAYPSLTKDDMPVNAVYGFFTMLFSLLQELKPDYFVVCFDKSKPTIRQAMYANYHANRPQMANDFYPQTQLVRELLAIMKVKVYELDGYEGDDLVGAIAHQTIEKVDDVMITIVTGDRDLLQLVNPKVKVLMPITGITKVAIFDEAAVEEKYGVKPSQFIDYKALIGDASDGYPGVTGIGPKTAAKLLQTYRTFENLYEHVGELPENVGLKLATDAEQAALAKKLATIFIDTPITFDIKECAVAAFDIAALRTKFKELDFNSLLAKLAKWYPEEAPKKKKTPEDDGQLGLL